MKSIVMSLLVLATLPAFANEAGDELANRTAFQGVASRQAVQDAYLQARRLGTLPVTSEAASLDVPVVTNRDTGRTEAREQARQAARQRIIHELL